MLSKAQSACDAVLTASTADATDETAAFAVCSAILRELARKVEEVHTTLRKHLAKEEHQLLPLLLQHFAFIEQAELVAQFLCSIPLAAVNPVLLWIKRTIPLEEQASLQQQVQAAVPDRLLKQLITTWLAPYTINVAADGGQGGRGGAHAAAEPQTPETSEGAEFVCCGRCTHHHGGGRQEDTSESNAAAAAGAAGLVVDSNDRNRSAAAATAGRCPRDVEDTAGDDQKFSIPSRKPPLREILYFHQAIRSALSSFAQEARALRDSDGGGGSTLLAALVERHRFIRAVCLFHSSSEDEIVFPALRKVSSAAFAAAQQQQQQHHHDEEAPSPMDASTSAASAEENGKENSNTDTASASTNRHKCEEEHVSESAQFEELGRLLGDVRACVRRGAKGVELLTQDLSQVADKLARAMSRHMAREETEVLPPLMRSLCLAEQRHMVWRLVRAMPLRLLERVMPWVAGKLREDDVKEWLGNIKQAAPVAEAPLVELLSQWALRGAEVAAAVASGGGGHGNGSAPTWRRGTDDPNAYSIETCTPARARALAHHDTTSVFAASASAAVAVATAAAAAATEAGGPPLKRIRTTKKTQSLPTELLMPKVESGSLPPSPNSIAAAAAAINNTFQENPIDHIFQFHKALRRELKELESEAIDLQNRSDAATSWLPGDVLSRSIQNLQAKFQFLRGIYRAHSSSEDEVIFPALEAKEALHNVSHAYALDHAQEERLFEEVAEVILGIGACSPPNDLANLRSLSSRLARMCAAVRASLETHVRAEETELWPLFAENFSVEEQQRLVGIIIGRTGAEVLHTMLSWVKGSMDEDEHSAMMLSIKSASKATAFEQWLETQGVEGKIGGGAGDAIGGKGGAGDSTTLTPSGVGTYEDEQREVLAEVAKYLAKQGLSAGGDAGGGGGIGTSIAGAGPSTNNAKPTSTTATPAVAPLAADPASVAADIAHFRPGWEDIFKLNQKQLEAAVRRVSADATLEPQRKAYLIQHLMASRYIVAQQKRAALVSKGGSAGATPTVGGTTTKTNSGISAGALIEHQHQHQIASTNEAVAMDITTAANACESTAPGAAAPHMLPEQPTNAGTAPAPITSSHRYFHDPSNNVLGCKHYRRRAILVSPCCGGEYVCRLCHDEAVPGHTFDRYAVTEMRCMECGTKQPVSAACTACNASMARYYCGICHLFDDDPHRDIYHCPFCNFCRRGKGLGVDSFHCMSCNACMSLELFNKHRCTERALAGTCPVCSDPLFDSSAPIKELPCGHFMHSMCFAAYTRYSYTCPVCSKSLGDMAVYWKMIDTLLEGEVLPAEYALRKQSVRCNDCAQETEAPFHFVYHKCGGCGGYNTRVV